MLQLILRRQRCCSQIICYLPYHMHTLFDARHSHFKMFANGWRTPASPTNKIIHNIVESMLSLNETNKSIYLNYSITTYILTIGISTYILTGGISTYILIIGISTYILTSVISIRYFLVASVHLNLLVASVHNTY